LRFHPLAERCSFITPKVEEEKGKEIATRILAAEAGRGFDLGGFGSSRQFRHYGFEGISRRSLALRLRRKASSIMAVSSTSVSGFRFLRLISVILSDCPFNPDFGIFSQCFKCMRWLSRLYPYIAGFRESTKRRRATISCVANHCLFLAG
jgi:hypothetical protein